MKLQQNGKRYYIFVLRARLSGCSANVLLKSVSVVTVSATVTQTPATVKVVPAKSRSLRIARFDTWEPSIAFGYITLPLVSCTLFLVLWMGEG